MDLLQSADYLGRDSADQSVGRDIFRHQRTGGNDGSRPNSHAGENSRPGSDPDAFPNMNWGRTVFSGSTLVCSDCMSTSHECYLIGKLGTAADHHRRGEIEAATRVDEHIITKYDAKAFLHLKAAAHEASFPDRRSI